MPSASLYGYISSRSSPFESTFTEAPLTRTYSTLPTVVSTVVFSVVSGVRIPQDFVMRGFARRTRRVWDVPCLMYCSLITWDSPHTQSLHSKTCGSVDGLIHGKSVIARPVRYVKDVHAVTAVTTADTVGTMALCCRRCRGLVDAAFNHVKPDEQGGPISLPSAQHKISMHPGLKLALSLTFFAEPGDGGRRFIYLPMAREAGVGERGYGGQERNGSGGAATSNGCWMLAAR